jgi:hypothetical protein
MTEDDYALKAYDAAVRAANRAWSAHRMASLAKQAADEARDLAGFVLYSRRVKKLEVGQND